MFVQQIGKRVYWPGSGLEIVEFDLLTIGDDVVFGSRSVVLTSTTEESKPIVFEAGSMIADRYNLCRCNDAHNGLSRRINTHTDFAVVVLRCCVLYCCKDVLCFQGWWFVVEPC